MAGPQRGGPCTHWIGAEHRHCHTADGVRQYLTGFRCRAHTPNALRGLPEVPPGPGIAADAALSPLSVSAVFDDLAVAKGKRRASPHVYKAARAAVDQRRDTSS